MPPSTLRRVLPIFEGDQLEAGAIFSILKDPIQDGGEGDMWLVKSVGVNMCKLVTNATILLKTRTVFVKDSIHDGGEGDMCRWSLRA